jgi:hypothetical protein
MANSSTSSHESGELVASAEPAMDYYDKPSPAAKHSDRLSALARRTAPKPQYIDKRLIGQRKGFKVLGLLL